MQRKLSVSELDYDTRLNLLFGLFQHYKAEGEAPTERATKLNAAARHKKPKL